MAHPGVVDVAVIGVPDERGGRRSRPSWWPRPASAPDGPDEPDRLLPPAVWPATSARSRWTSSSTLPRNPSGKLLKRGVAGPVTGRARTPGRLTWTARRRTIYEHQVRYLEADQQGVVFNMWYLGYFDEAMAPFLDEGGLPIPTCWPPATTCSSCTPRSTGSPRCAGRTRPRWRWRWREAGRRRLPSTSRSSTAGSRLVATGRTVYVVVATDGSGKRPIPGRPPGRPRPRRRPG